MVFIVLKCVKKFRCRARVESAMEEIWYSKELQKRNYHLPERIIKKRDFQRDRELCKNFFCKILTFAMNEI